MNDETFDQCAAIIEKLDQDEQMPADTTAFYEAMAAARLSRKQFAVIEAAAMAVVGDTQHAAFRLGWTLARQ